MVSNKYLEGKSMQRPPLFESDHFIYWKNRFKTYVKVKDLDLWHIILNGDFPPIARNKETQILEFFAFEEQSDDLKKKLAKNNEAKIVLYNALPKKEYERIFMCKTAKDIWQSLLITHQGNSQVKDNKIDLLVQQYEKFTILEEESMDCPKPSRNKDQKAFIGGSWSDSENDAKDKTNDETCLMDQSSNEVTLNSSCYSDNTSSLGNDSMQIEYDSLCEISLKITNKNKILKTKRDLLEKEILELYMKIKKLERSKEIEIACKSCEELKLENTKLKKTQVKFVKFDKSANSLREMLNNQKSPSFKIGLGFDSGKASTSKTKTISFVGSSIEKAMDGSTIKVHESTLPRSVCLRTCLKPDEWLKDSGCSKHMTGNKSFFSTFTAYDREHVDNLAFNLLSVGQICENKCQVLFTKEGSEMIRDGKIFFYQSKYIKEKLKKFGLEDSKPTKMPMSTEIKLTKDDEADSVDSFKYHGMIGSLLYLTVSRADIMFSVCLCDRFQENPKTTHLEVVKRIFRYIGGTSHLGLWYPKGTVIETIVYADSDHAGDYVDRKRTSGVCTFMGCCLTSWFAKKQTTLAISTTEAEYVCVGKACEQALWMKQALIDYDICFDDVLIIIRGVCHVRWGKVTWGGRAKVFGTIPMCVGVQEKAYGGEGVLAG
nr:uncharacterized mitochondrial protein AtMg00810-like [Tanacetum cinerariifolium]